MWNKFKENKIMRNLIYMDFIGPMCGFEDNDSLRFKSFPGALFSYMIIITVIVISFLFGKEIYEKKLPIVSVNNEFLQESRIYLYEFPIIFHFRTKHGIELNNFSYFMEEITINITMDSGNKITKEFNKLKLTDCRLKTYTNNSSDIQDLIKLAVAATTAGNMTYYCLDFDQETYFQNDFYSTNSVNYNIGFRYCLPNNGEVDTETNNNDESKTNYCPGILNSNTTNVYGDNISNITVDDLLLTFYYINSYVDFDVVNKPIQSYWETVNYELSASSLQKTFMRFAINSMNSDIGWLLEDLREYTYVQLDSKILNEQNIPPTGDNKDMVYALSLESPRFRQVISRQYMKLQDLFAKIGGIMNALLIFVKVISYHYLRFLYIYYVRDMTKETVEKKRFAYKPGEYSFFLDDYKNNNNNNYKLKKSISNNVLTNISNKNSRRNSKQPDKIIHSTYDIDSTNNFNYLDGNNNQSDNNNTDYNNSKYRNNARTKANKENSNNNNHNNLNNLNKILECSIEQDSNLSLEEIKLALESNSNSKSNNNSNSKNNRNISKKLKSSIHDDLTFSNKSIKRYTFTKEGSVISDPEDNENNRNNIFIKESNENVIYDDPYDNLEVKEKVNVANLHNYKNLFNPKIKDKNCKNIYTTKSGVKNSAKKRLDKHCIQDNKKYENKKITNVHNYEFKGPINIYTNKYNSDSESNTKIKNNLLYSNSHFNENDTNTQLSESQMNYSFNVKEESTPVCTLGNIVTNTEITSNSMTKKSSSKKSIMSNNISSFNFLKDTNKLKDDNNKDIKADKDSNYKSKSAIKSRPKKVSRTNSRSKQSNIKYIESKDNIKRNYMVDEDNLDTENKMINRKSSNNVTKLYKDNESTKAYYSKDKSTKLNNNIKTTSNSKVNKKVDNKSRNVSGEKTYRTTNPTDFKQNIKIHKDFINNNIDNAQISKENNTYSDSKGLFNLEKNNLQIMNNPTTNQDNALTESNKFNNNNNVQNKNDDSNKRYNLTRFKTRVDEQSFGYINYLYSILCFRKQLRLNYEAQMMVVKHAISFKILTNLLLGYILEETTIIGDTSQLN